MRKRKISSFLLSCLVMLSLIASIVLAGQATIASATDDQGVNPADAVRLTIVHTNDTHARVKEGDGMGFAKISTLIKQLKQENPNTLVLDGGDTFHGQTIATLNKGESIAKIMNTIGYDAMAPASSTYM